MIRMLNRHRYFAFASLVAISLLTCVTPRAWALEIERLQLSNGAVLLGP